MITYDKQRKPMIINVIIDDFNNNLFVLQRIKMKIV